MAAKSQRIKKDEEFINLWRRNLSLGHRISSVSQKRCKTDKIDEPSKIFLIFASRSLVLIFFKIKFNELQELIDIFAKHTQKLLKQLQCKRAQQHISHRSPHLIEFIEMKGPFKKLIQINGLVYMQTYFHLN